MRTGFNIEKMTKKKETLKDSGFPKKLDKNETAVDILKRDLMGWATWSSFDISDALNKGLMDL